MPTSTRPARPRDPRRPDPRTDSIRLEGVRTHNLQGFDVSIPLGRTTVITGVSGSGKSSLAFDTLYAEGRRRFVECLSTYTQQFLERMERPAVDAAHALPPAVALERSRPAAHARSTVGSVTEIGDHLRLLFARVGEPHCVRCGRLVREESPGVVADEVVAAGGRGSVHFEADLPAHTKDWKRMAAELERGGFARLWQDGAVVPLADARTPEARPEVVVDRLDFAPQRRARIVEAVEIAYRFGHERCIVRAADRPPRRFSRRLHCPDCDVEVRKPEPQLFSANSPIGACPACQGFGRNIEPDLERIIPDPGLTLKEKPIDPWNKPAYRSAYTDLRRATKGRGLDWNVPYRELPDEHREWIEKGAHGFYGIQGFFDWLEGRTYKVHVRVFLARYRAYRPCSACSGRKLRGEALAVRVAGRNFAEVGVLPVAELHAWIRELDLREPQREIAAPILAELERRLGVLVEVGLGYLALDRPSRTLAGGEYQRILLARALGAALVGTLYVLDEPSVGLHPLDVDRLSAVLGRLRDLGNTVVLVEHDPRMIRAADHVIDLGPGAGAEGGRVLYAGPPAALATQRGSLTGEYLAGRRSVERRSRPAVTRSSAFLELAGAATNNLRDVTARFPRRALSVVTGVSGSGKSSLVHDTLHGALARVTGGARVETGPYRELRGADGLHAVELVDQSPIGRTPRSNPVTYVKAFEGMRRRLAATKPARAQGLGPGHFSFNVPGGRCETCEGAGSTLLEMHFLPDLLVPCEDCGGARFGPSALEIRDRGKNVAEILELTVAEALRFYADAPDVAERLRVLDEVGLGYLRLGQPAPTLSGGEAQRLKLAAHLGRGSDRPMVFLLDEPTTGLHLHDVAVLVRLLDRLVEDGHTVIVVEHHLELIRAADWVVDLGPGAGPEGGTIVAQGPPAVVARSEGATGRYLAAMLGSPGA